MVKRILVVVISLNILLVFMAFSPKSYETKQMPDVIKQIAPYITEDESSTVTRGNCITTIMKIVGIDKEVACWNATSEYDPPVFHDIERGDILVGYIVQAKFINVATGTAVGVTGAKVFEQDREVTIKECLAFMLRCLDDTDKFAWNDIMERALEYGLLDEPDRSFYGAGGEKLTSKDFAKLLSRMLNSKRYLYWPNGPTEPMPGLPDGATPPPGWSKTVQKDASRSISYMDWVLENIDIVTGDYVTIGKEFAIVRAKGIFGTLYPQMDWDNVQFDAEEMDAYWKVYNVNECEIEIVTDTYYYASGELYALVDKTTGIVV